MDKKRLIAGLLSAIFILSSFSGPLAQVARADYGEGDGDASVIEGVSEIIVADTDSEAEAPQDQQDQDNDASGDDAPLSDVTAPIEQAKEDSGESTDSEPAEGAENADSGESDTQSMTEENTQAGNADDVADSEEETPETNDDAAEAQKDAPVANVRFRVEMSGTGGAVIVKAQGASTRFERSAQDGKIRSKNLLDPQAEEQIVALIGGRYVVDLTLAPGSVVSVAAETSEGFEVSRYRVLADGGTTFLVEQKGSVSRSITCDGADYIVSVVFAEQAIQEEPAENTPSESESQETPVSGTDSAPNAEQASEEQGAESVSSSPNEANSSAPADEGKTEDATSESAENSAPITESAPSENADDEADQGNATDEPASREDDQSSTSDTDDTAEDKEQAALSSDDPTATVDGQNSAVDGENGELDNTQPEATGDANSPESGTPEDEVIEPEETDSVSESKDPEDSSSEQNEDPEGSRTVPAEGDSKDEAKEDPSTAEAIASDLLPEEPEEAPLTLAPTLRGLLGASNGITYKSKRMSLPGNQGFQMNAYGIKIKNRRGTSGYGSTGNFEGQYSLEEVVTSDGRTISAFCTEWWLNFIGNVDYADVTGLNESVWEQSFTDAERNHIAMIMALGATDARSYATFSDPNQSDWTGGDDTWTTYLPLLGITSPSDHQKYYDAEKKLATQILIHEYINGMGAKDMLHGCSSSYRTLYVTYDEIVRRLSQHGKIPSFATTSSGGGTPYSITKSGSNYVITLTDSNGILGDYDFTGNSTTGITVTQSGNTVTITVAASAVGSLKNMVFSATSPWDRYASKDNVVFLESANPSSQNLVYLNGSSPVKAYFKLEAPTAEIYVKKTISPNSNLAAICPAYYDVTGTQFTVYKRLDNSVVGVLTVKADGTTNTLEVEAGYEYRIVETTTKPGFVKAADTYYTPESGGQTYEISIANEPHFDPDNITLTKKGGNNEAIPGAIFTVSYYSDVVSSMSGLNGKTPVRVWTFKTDANGYLDLNDNNTPKKWLTSGTLFTDASGNVVLLPGTYKFEETGVPSGFVGCDPFIITATINSDGSFSHTAIDSSHHVTNEGTAAFKLTEEYQPKYVYVKKTTPASSAYLNAHPLSGAVYSLYSDAACATPIKTSSGSNATLTVKADGTSDIIELQSSGTSMTVYYKETTAPAGYKLDTTVGSITIPASNTRANPALINVSDAALNGYGTLVKSTTASADYQARFPLTGIVYTVYTDQACTQVAKVFKTGANAVLTVKADGTTDAIELQEGTYWAKETSTVRGYAINTAPIKLEIVADKTATIRDTDAPNITDASVIKSISPDKNLTDLCPDYYDLTGTEFTIYRVSDNHAMGVLTVAANGKTNTVELETNVQYKLVETKVMPGFEQAPDKLFTPTQGDAPYEISVANKPVFDDLQIQLVKVEEDEQKPVVGAVFTVSYYTEQVDNVDGLNGLTPKKVWKYKTDANGTFILADDGATCLTPADLYRDAAGNVVGLPGTYLFEETEAPLGFAAIDPFVMQIDIDSTGSLVHSASDHLNNVGDKLEMEDEYQTVSISIRKTNEDGTATAYAYGSWVGATFGVYKYDAMYDRNDLIGIVTIGADGTGSYEGLRPGLYHIFELEAPPGYLLNGNEFIVRGGIKEPNTKNFEYVVTIPEKEIQVEIRKVTWDNDGEIIALADAGLELHKETATGELVEAWTTTADGKKIFRALPAGTYVLIEASTPGGFRTAEPLTFTVERVEEVQTFEMLDYWIPLISTTAAGTDGEKVLVATQNNVTIVDTVTYSGLQVGKEHELVAYLHDQATGALLKDASGEPYKVTTKFTTEHRDGEIEVSLVVPTALVKDGAILTVYEYLYLDGELIASHEEPDDAKQTVYIPGVKTTADDGSGNKNIPSAATVTIQDVVAYTGLEPNKEYGLKTYLLDKKTGARIKNADGTDFVVESTFTTSASNGTVTVSIQVPGELVTGKTLVVEEHLYQESRELAIHADITDIPQTVYVPELQTSAADKDGNKTIVPEQDTVTIWDTVTYSGVEPGKDYTVTTYLLDKKANTVLQNESGEPFKVTTTVTATEANGTWKIKIEVPASLVMGKTLVVAEHLYEDSREIAVHHDFNSEPQTVKVPDLRTLASGDDDDKLITIVTGKAVIHDEVSYESLIAGEEHTLVTYLIDKATGELILDESGNPFKTETKFTPATEDGKVNVTIETPFEIVLGKIVVVAEHLWYEGREIAVHHNVDDEKQTVYVPKIGTTATDADGNKLIAVNGEPITIVDTVAYDAVVPGRNYTLKAKLMFNDGSFVKNEDGSDFEVETAFTPESASGTTKVTITVPLELVEGHTITIAEYLYLDTLLVTEHEDAEDEEQTVYIPELRTHAYTEEGTPEAKVHEHKAKVQVYDRISYSGLQPGKEYTVSTFLMDKKDGSRIFDVDGNDVTLTTTFTPTESEGELIVCLETEHEIVTGRTIVVEEHLFEEEREVAAHADIEDEEQTTWVPEIKTSAADKDGNKTIKMADTITIVDTITFSGVKPGETYEIRTRLYDQTDGKANLIRDAKGAFVQSSEWTPTESEGEYKLEITISGEYVEGKIVVVAEWLYLDGKLVAEHDDAEDEEQTVYIPELHTTADDGEGNKEIAHSEKVTIHDEVVYESLIPNKEYELKTYVLDKANGAMLRIDGEPVELVTKFTPEAASGSIVVEIELPGELVLGKVVVVAEHLYEEGREIAFHHDITDEPQTVYFPDLHTTVGDKSGNTVIVVENKTYIYDAVEYSGLEPGKEHELKTYLLDKSGDGTFLKNADGTDFVVVTKFTPTASKGKIVVEIQIDGSLISGKTLVVAEYCYRDGREIAVHHNLEDVAQTFLTPELQTTAADADGNKVINIPGATVDIYDTVSYKGLVNGIEHQMRTQLIDKKTGEVIRRADGSIFETYTTFTPKSSEGEIVVKITVPAELVSGKIIVVGEHLYLENREIALHHDVEDEDQTVYLPELHTTATVGGRKTVSQNAGTIELQDVISYHGLKVGDVVTFTGCVVDKSTGKVLKDKSGNEIISATTITVESPDGEVTVKFSVNVSGMKGKTLVVFETATVQEPNGEKRVIGKHEDLNDKEQSINIVDYEIPNTSDSDHPWIWISTLTASLSAGAYLLLKKRKKEDEAA